MYQVRGPLPVFLLLVSIFLLVSRSLAFFHGTKSAPSAAYFQQQIEQPGGAYQFSYETGSKSNTDEARSFREESRDEYGNVVGKYGYYDPYGHLRVVNYRAGPDGYHAEGDIGVDEETIRQQRLLYSNDEATQIQQDAWKDAESGGSGAGFVSPALAGSSVSSSSSSSSSASSSTSSSSSSSSGFYGTGIQPSVHTTIQQPAVTTIPRQDWTTVNSVDSSDVINQQYNVKGQRVYDRLVAPQPIKSPVTLNYQTTSSQYNLPTVRQYSTTTLHTVPGAVHQPTYYIQSAPAPILSPAPAPAARYFAKSTKTYQSGALKSPFTSRYTEQQTTNTVPVAPASFFSKSSQHQTSAASASASASASSSSFSGAQSPSYFAGSTKGGSSQAVSPYRSARYSAPRTGKAHATVNFKQFGPQPYQYSYSF